MARKERQIRTELVARDLVHSGFNAVIKTEAESNNLQGVIEIDDGKCTIIVYEKASLIMPKFRVGNSERYRNGRVVADSQELVEVIKSGGR